MNQKNRPHTWQISPFGRRPVLATLTFCILIFNSLAVAQCQNYSTNAGDPSVEAGAKNIVIFTGENGHFGHSCTRDNASERVKITLTTERYLKELERGQKIIQSFTTLLSKEAWDFNYLPPEVRRQKNSRSRWSSYLWLPSAFTKSLRSIVLIV